MKIYKIRNSLFCITILVIFTHFSFAENTFIDKAMKYKKAGNWENATMAFLSVLEKDSDCAECYFHLGEIEENKLNYEKASYYYEKASYKNPRYYARLGYCFQTMLHWGKSINSFKKYLNFFPDDVKVSESLGISYRKSGNLKDSEIIFKSILRNNPQNITSLFNLSQIYLDKYDNENAMVYFEQYKSASELKTNQGKNVRQ